MFLFTGCPGSWLCICQGCDGDFTSGLPAVLGVKHLVFKEQLLLSSLVEGLRRGTPTCHGPQ